MNFDVIKRHPRAVSTRDWRRHTAGLCIVVLAAVTGACGSSGSRGTPKPPTAVIEVENWLVDVGGTYALNGDMSVDFNGDTDLDYFWTGLNQFATVSWDDHCEDFPDEICDENFNDVCDEPQKTECTVNRDCEVGECKIGKQVCAEKQVTFCNNDDDCKEGDCRTNSGDSSPDCTSGTCNIGGGQTGIIGNFEATVPGPYFVRLLVTGDEANNIALQLLDTYPSMYLLGGPMDAFGGTEGGLVGRSEDADIFAPGAVRGVSNPASGNLLLAVPSLGSVREFDFITGEIVGTFGETNSTTEPISLAFNDGGRLLYVANEDGLVQVFDGVTGLAGADFGDVTIGTQRVLSLLFEPNGNLLVIDGRLGQGIREYDADTGVFLGIYGDTGTAVTQATDAIFFGDPPAQMLVSDGAGDVIACDQNGRNCGSWGSAGAMLVAGGPTSITENPSGDINVSAQVLIGDRFNQYVLGCDDTGNGCEPFGDTTGLDSEYYDVFFAPPELATTTTTTTLPFTSTSSTSSSTLSVATTSTSSTSSTTIITSTTTIPASPTSAR